jgi:PKD repeat protein
MRISRKSHLFSLVALLSYSSIYCQEEPNTGDPLIIDRTIDSAGREIIGILINGVPPKDHREPISIPTRNAVLLNNAPAFDWSWGCFATAAAMAAGYYDNNGYPNMYDGPMNDGLMPLDNSSWRSIIYNGEQCSQCPLSATCKNLDGRTSNGHVNDYYQNYLSADADPFLINAWTEHVYGDCTGDYLGTSQSSLGEYNIDGSTCSWYNLTGYPLYNYTGCEPGGRDGCHGLRDFYESRGYEVIQNYSQYIYGYKGFTNGFTFEQYQNEINQGRPVILLVYNSDVHMRHALLGIGYDAADSLVYLHDTWDYFCHTMIWGGNYYIYQHQGVMVFELSDNFFSPVANFSTVNPNSQINETISFTDLSDGNPFPNSWSWSINPGNYIFVDNTSPSSQNPHIQFSTEGLYTVSLVVTIGTSSDTITKTDYINVYDCQPVVLPFSEDFSDGFLPQCWSNIDHRGNGFVWAFNNPADRMINTSTTENGFAILDAWNYWADYDSIDFNTDLISPKFDFSEFANVNISFQHHFEENFYGASGSLSYSIDDGNTWNLLNSWTESTLNDETYCQDLSSYLGNEPDVIFKWNYSDNWGSGNYWALDDIKIFDGLLADFNADNPFVMIDDTVHFTDITLGIPGPTSWSWNITPNTYFYINNTTSFSQYPQVEFTSDGLYSVSLTVSNGTSSDTLTKADYIHVYDYPEITYMNSEDFSDGYLPPGWTIVDHLGNGQVWKIKSPGKIYINTETAYNGFAILNSNFYGNSDPFNCDLITPLLDLSDYTGVVVSFQHNYVSQSESSASFSYSIDAGNTWTILQTWTTKTTNPAYFNQDVSTVVSGQSNVKFKWNYAGTWGYFYYWALDDIAINVEGPGKWTGEVSSVWSDTSNWAYHNIPGSTDNAIIDSSAENWPVFNGNFNVGAYCANLILKDSADMTINGNFTIPYGKSLVFTGTGQLTLGGDWINNGVFTPGNGTVIFNGNTSSNLKANIIDNSITDYIRETINAGMTSLTNASPGPTGNDGYLNVPIGFDFRYMGNTCTQAHLTTNGYVSLQLDAGSRRENERLFNNSVPNMTFAPWWDDLKTDNIGLIKYKTEGDSPNRSFTVEWSRILSHYNNSTTRISFQLKLFETSGVIEYHYGTKEEGMHNTHESASIGLEDAIGGTGHFIEATTGSTTVGISDLKSQYDWPTVNYRFSPTILGGNFHNIVVAKTGGAELNINSDVNVSGTLTIQPGASFKIPDGEVVNINELNK